MSPNPAPFKLTRIASLKTAADFRAHIASLGLDLPCEDAIVEIGRVKSRNAKVPS